MKSNVLLLLLKEDFFLSLPKSGYFLLAGAFNYKKQETTHILFLYPQLPI